MGWVATVVLNLVITVAYLGIAGLVLRGLILTRQVRTNPLALATSLIFLSCAAHHGHHAIHVWESAAEGQVRATFGTWHSVVIDVLGATIAVVYLGMRRRYGALLNTPSMFEDRVAAEAERRLREMAFRDQLTGLANRAALAESVRRLEDQPGRSVVVSYIDLDGFKPVNDTYGHDAGDRVLCEVASRLEGARQHGDEVFRLGGDEFLILTRGGSHVARGRLPLDLGLRDGAADWLADIQGYADAIAAPIGIRDGGSIRLGCSIGVARGTTGTDSAEDLIRRADSAMYLAKRRGSGIEAFDGSGWDLQTYPPTQRRPADLWDPMPAGD